VKNVNTFNFQNPAQPPFSQLSFFSQRLFCIEKNIRKYNFYFLDPLIIRTFLFEKFVHRQADFLKDAEETACWDLANSWFGK
jgi:hypothetical protein